MTGDCQYPPYVRNTLKITPYWKNYKVGDRAYRIESDEFYRCVKPCVRLDALFEETDEQDYGLSPVELGFMPDQAAYWWPENWEIEKKKVANAR